MSADDDMRELMTIEEVQANLTHALRIASTALPEIVPNIANALDWLAQEQLGLADLKSSKQQKLGRLHTLLWKLRGCDAGERNAYIMDQLDLSPSTYHEYVRILDEANLTPHSGKLGVANETDGAGA